MGRILIVNLNLKNQIWILNNKEIVKIVMFKIVCIFWKLKTKQSVNHKNLDHWRRTKLTKEEYQIIINWKKEVL